ncbi:MAG: leucyl aminopeptidase family protein [Candidatus Wolfebacteria bacterium]|nr:leucyl aminopeptidase family protein [Candidatus Wolfebacteria bacterium]
MKIKFSEKSKKKNIVLSKEKESFCFLLADGGKSLKIGLGDYKDLNRRKLVITSRQIVSLAKTNKIKKLSLEFSDFLIPNLKMKGSEIAGVMATNFLMANFEFVKYKTAPKEGWNFVEEVEISGKISDDAKKEFLKGVIIGEETNNCRSLANTPGGEMTPKMLAGAAKRAGRYSGIKVKVFDEKAMAKLKMNAILGVGKGSVEKPKFIVMEYSKGPKKEKPVVLIGKGVTFDTGGLNIKTDDYQKDMHMDMSGAASVISAVTLAARLKIKKNIVGLIPSAENMPSGSSYRQGDLIKSMSGKTIEVSDTDAEGRIILADALTYAQKYNPKLVVDVATLTGAAEVALGQRASAILTKDEKLEKLFRELGEESGDYVWPLPLWDEYEDDIKGTFGDWANTGKTRYGGAITGAIFLYQFVPSINSGQAKVPWVHMDIAPRMISIDGEYLAKGAAGAPVRLLVKLLEKF